MNTSWRSVPAARMLGRMRYAADSISDLHAAEARYHRDCMCRLFAKRLTTTAQEVQSQNSDSYYQPYMALKHLITMLSFDKKRVWSSVELCQEYHDDGRIDLNLSQLVENLCSHFDGDLPWIFSPGYANVVSFQCHAAVSLKMNKDLENSIRHVAKQVRKECKDIPLDTTKYRLNIDEQLAHESVSGTVQNLLASISTKLDSNADW